MKSLNHLSRRSVSALCAIALIATSLAHAFAQQPATAKRAITHKDYDAWHSIQSPQISRDGKFVAYAYMAQDEDSEIVARNLATGQEWRAPRGYRPPAPPPDVWITDANFKAPKKISNGDAQRAQFNWGTAELVNFKNTDGVPLKGLLLKPENFDPKKKYPMIVYIYERLSQGLHAFRAPGPGISINPPYYVNNGYLIFMPDIVYTTGYPGQSAMKCVLPGIHSVVDKGFVDENAIGIQGHSWGGYQIAYMVTQTNRFKAAAPGAVVANMTSAYSGIRWGSGLPRQFQYEHSQSRIGGSLWEYPMRYLENSPVFRADRVQTPLLMIHNDEDDAVPWYQGIEYYLALRRLGKEVYMFSYNGEKHGLRRRINQKDYTRRLQEFFDHFLKGAPAPEWMQKGIPYLQREKEKEKYRVADQDEPLQNRER